jgi:glycosyltransferase involved in cell wall biosynthesis
MKKILLVAADGFSKTGVPTVFMNIVRSLSSVGYRFDIIYFDTEFDYYLQEFLSFGGKCFLLDKQYKNRLLKKTIRYISGNSYYKKTKKILSENGPYDAIHCFKEYISCYFLKAAKDCNVPLRIYHCNNIIRIAGNPINRILMRSEKKKCLLSMNKIIGCSQEACISAFPNTDFEVINNPYNDSDFFFVNSNENAFKGLTLVQTGGFNNNKNQLFSLKIVKELKEKYNVRLFFVGADLDYKYRKRVDKEVIKLGLQSNIIFKPFDTCQRDIFAISNYFLLPSISESFGIVLIEAQATGLRCIASTGVPSSSDVGGCLRVPLSKGPKFWAELIDADYKKNQGKRNRYDCSAFSKSKIIVNYVKIYEGK